MIKQITKLKGFGIFTDFKCTPATVREFKRFNLIYGWNGSGKSTLTKLFECIEKKRILDDFISATFNISTNGHDSITNLNIHENVLNVRVFNQDFINDNIQWNNDNKTAKSILILSEEKIEERKKLEELNKEIKQKSADLQTKEIELSEEMRNRDTFLSSTAKSIKESFKIIDTSDTHYFNYSKPKLDAFILNNKANLVIASSILEAEELNVLTTSIKPNSKPDLIFITDNINIEELKIAEEKIKTLIESSVFNEAILRLKENPDIQEWVKEGFALHQKHNSESCEYCGNIISKERIAIIKNHFNDDYLGFIEKLDNAINWVEGKKLRPIILPDASDLYDEFQKEYLVLKDFYSQRTEELNNLLDRWLSQLQAKKLNPFIEDRWELNGVGNITKELCEVILKVRDVKTRHNLKTENFEAELKRLKTKLETHYASEAIKETDHFDLEDKIALIEKESKELSENVAKLKKEAFEIEKELTDEVKGAAKFNELLHGFLGRDDISLQFMEAEKGYKILRKGSNQRAKNLSEGEKTAIAFIYFSIKLKENGNDISETIVVIDDPVSSLDSNHLIHAYSFLKNQCTDVKQLFVLTHNFHFFKLIRDWIFYVSPTDGDKNYFTINCSCVNGLRESILCNANNFLLKYNSEYHFLFYKLNEYSKKEDIDVDDMFIIANLARRFIESLITFKYPKKTKDLWEKFKKVDFEEIEKIKIYKFINLYSHNDKIESHESFSDNLFAEGKSLITSTLEFIKAIDEDHYTELVSIYN